MKTIWKFPVPIIDTPVINMPLNAKILSIALQHGAPYLWAIVEDDAPKRDYRFALIGTGSSMPIFDTDEYIGSFQLHDGFLVFHLFYRN